MLPVCSFSQNGRVHFRDQDLSRSYSSIRLLPINDSEVLDSGEFSRVVGYENKVVLESDCGNLEIVRSYPNSAPFKVSAND